jgi:hypothetical protein
MGPIGPSAELDQNSKGLFGFMSELYRPRVVAPGKRGGLNGSTQHSVRTPTVLKTKAKIAR